MQLCSKQPGTPVQVANEAEERSEKGKGYAEKGRRETKWKGQGGVRKKEDKEEEKEEFGDDRQI